MKLKLQFWKTPRKLLCCLLDHDNLPSISTGPIQITHNYSEIELYCNKICFGVKHKFERIDEICCDTCNHRSQIDFYVNTITKELFTPKKQEIKVGDIVTIKGECDKYKVLHILPEKYSNRYILTQGVNFNGSVLWVYADEVIPITPQLKFTKEVTDSIETYTWEI